MASYPLQATNSYKQQQMLRDQQQQQQQQRSQIQVYRTPLVQTKQQQNGQSNGQSNGAAPSGPGLAMRCEVAAETRFNASTRYYVFVKGMKAQTGRKKTYKDFALLHSRVRPKYKQVPPMPKKNGAGKKFQRVHEISRGVERLLNDLLSRYETAGDLDLCTFVGITPDAALHGKVEKKESNKPWYIEHLEEAGEFDPMKRGTNFERVSSAPTSAEIMANTKGTKKKQETERKQKARALQIQVEGHNGGFFRNMHLPDMLTPRNMRPSAEEKKKRRKKKSRGGSTTSDESWSSMELEIMKDPTIVGQMQRERKMREAKEKRKKKREAEKAVKEAQKRRSMFGGWGEYFHRGHPAAPGQVWGADGSLHPDAPPAAVHGQLMQPPPAGYNMQQMQVHMMRGQQQHSAKALQMSGSPISPRFNQPMRL
mmetsp:Transcript_37816/g.92949  ORF Transcript_37816/g.92949 Transcript_37816/m.92949 type:complete len:424 (-) Transcript_37816:342-1613(-)